MQNVDVVLRVILGFKSSRYWADKAELAQQLGKVVQYPNQILTNPMNNMLRTRTLYQIQIERISRFLKND